MRGALRAATSFAVVLVSVLAGCGGGGKGGSASGGTTVAGVVAIGDTAVSGAQVELLDGGNAVGRGTSAPDGSFRVTWPGTVPAAGLRLVATGGTAAGAATSGALAAGVLPGDDLTRAHVTPLTALVVRLGEALGAVTLADGRAAAEQRLTALGVLAPGDWRALSPASVGLGDLRREAIDRGASALVDAVAAELAAGELSATWMRCFPGAHGGIVAVTVGGGGGLTTPAGSSATFQVAAQHVGAPPAAGHTFRLVGAPAWATIDEAGVLAVSPPAEVAGTSPALSVRVEVGATGLGRTVGVPFSAPAPEVAAAGAVGPEGGTLLDDTGEVGVDVPPGAASGPTVVQVRRWVNEEGLPAYEVTSDPPLDGVRLQLAGAGGAVTTSAPAAAGAGVIGVRTLRSARVAVAAAATDPWSLVSVDVRQRTVAPFDLVTLQRLPWTDGGTAATTPFAVTSSLASVLLAVTDPAAPPRDRDPVIFIHGYDLLGRLGYGTWGNFIPLLYRLDAGGGRGYQPYEFRWSTAARFEDAAADLRTAVDLVAAETHRRVHLVAHSFGGLLARTYLQGLASRPAGEASYATPVASLTTLGTPHSGVSGVDADGLPDGRDATVEGAAIAACFDLTCYEAGGGEVAFVNRALIAARFDVAVVPGSLPRALADLAAHPLPGIPIQVLKGVTVDAATANAQGGDGLISVAGQRFSPSGVPDPDLVASFLTQAVMIGYRHTGAIFDRPGTPEAAVSCVDAQSCPHEGWVRVTAFLNAHRASAYGGDVSPPTIPAGVSAVGTGTSTVQVTWSPSTDDLGVAGYDVERVGGSTARVSATTWSDAGLRAATRYCYRVTAVDGTGKRSGSSATACATTLGPIDTTPPTAPTGLHAVSVGTSRVDLAWTASTDDVGVSLYRLHRDGAAIQVTAGTAGFDAGLGAGQRHCYRVVATDAAGNPSAPSAELCVTTLAGADVTPPSIPSGVTVVSTGAGQLTVRWSAAWDASGVTGYRVYRNGSLVGEVTGTSLVNGNLAAATQYCFAVSALDAARNASLPSSLVCATTPAGADTTPPTIPGGLTATVAGPTRVSLAWTASTDNLAVAGYHVFRDGQLLRTTTTASADDTSIATGRTYCYAVSAFDAARNESTRGPAACVTPVASVISPRVSVSPASGAKGVPFSEPGIDFTPGGMVVLHFRKPNGVELTATTSADAQGRYAWVYDSSTADQRGTFTYWAVDVATGKASPSVTFQITADALLQAYGLPPSVTLEGDAQYVASIANQTGAALAGVYLQAWIEQAPARRAASGAMISCGAGTGTLPPGGCMVLGTLVASNAADGTGTLAPGAATAVVELRRSVGGVDELLDSRGLPVTLVNAVAAPALSGAGGGTWAYRREISVISSAPAQGAYVVPVLLDTSPLVWAGKLRPDGGDLRFATPGGSELPWWPEGGVSSTAAPTKAWVRLDALPTGARTVYAYYGNPSAALGGAFASSGKRTFDVFDDFEAGWLDPALWGSTSVRYQSAYAQAGAAHFDASWPNNENNGGAFLRPVPTFSRSMVAEFRMTRNAQPLDSTWKSLLFSVRVEPAAAVPLQSTYAQVASGWWSNGVYDCAALDGTYEAQVRVDVDARSLAMTLGGTPCGSKTLGLAAGSSWALDLVDEGGYGSDTVDLWDFRMRPYVDPEPVASVSTAEQALAH